MRVQEGDGFSIQTDAEFYRPLCGILKKLKVTGLGYTFPPKSGTVSKCCQIC